MKLLFDLGATQPNRSGKRHGGGRYGEVMLLRMAERGIPVSCFYDSRLWLSPQVEEAVRQGNIPLFDVAGSSAQQIVSQGGFTRVYSCLPKRIVSLTGCELYGTLHGVRGTEVPLDKAFWQYRNPVPQQVEFIVRMLCPKLYRRVRERDFRRVFVDSRLHIVVVSEHTKHAVKAFYPEMKGRELPVFYSPDTTSGPPAPVDSGERYFLIVSGNRWEKNALRAIKAFDRLVSAGLIEGVRMKVTGVGSASAYRYKLRNADAFDFVGYVSDEELTRLYAGAYVFVYPSLNEGFGYPPLEAMRHGVPVIASPFTSMAEVLDSAALYTNPFLVEELMNRMMMMMEPDVHKEFAQRALNQSAKVRERQARDLDGVIDYITRE